MNYNFDPKKPFATLYCENSRFDIESPMALRDVTLMQKAAAARLVAMGQYQSNLKWGGIVGTSGAALALMTLMYQATPMNIWTGILFTALCALFAGIVKGLFSAYLFELSNIEKRNSELLSAQQSIGYAIPSDSVVWRNIGHPEIEKYVGLVAKQDRPLTVGECHELHRVMYGIKPNLTPLGNVHCETFVFTAR